MISLNIDYNIFPCYTCIELAINELSMKFVDKGCLFMYYSITTYLKGSVRQIRILKELMSCGKDLWNDALYFKLHYSQYGFSKCPNYKETYAFLKDSYAYKMLPSHSAQYIMRSLDSLYWSSVKYDFIDRPKSRYAPVPITFLRHQIRENNDKLRLSLTRFFKNDLNLKRNSYLNIYTKAFNDKSLRSITIYPLSKGNYKIIGTYFVEDKDALEDNFNHLYLSMGKKYTLAGLDTNGSSFLYTGLWQKLCFYRDKIDAYYEHTQRKRGVCRSKKAKSLFFKRKCVVKDTMHKMTRAIVSYCLSQNITRCFIDRFSIEECSYQDFLFLLKYKLKAEGIILSVLKRQEESEDSSTALISAQGVLCHRDVYRAFLMLKEKEKCDFSLFKKGLCSPKKIVF